MFSTVAVTSNHKLGGLNGSNLLSCSSGSRNPKMDLTRPNSSCQPVPRRSPSLRGKPASWHSKPPGLPCPSPRAPSRLCSSASADPRLTLRGLHHSSCLPSSSNDPVVPVGALWPSRMSSPSRDVHFTTAPSSCLSPKAARSRFRRTGGHLGIHYSVYHSTWSDFCKAWMRLDQE